MGSWLLLVIVEKETPYAAHTRHVGEDKYGPHARAAHACTMSARTDRPWPVTPRTLTIITPLRGAKSWQLRRCRLPGRGLTSTRPGAARCVPGRLRRHDTHVASMEQWGVSSR